MLASCNLLLIKCSTKKGTEKLYICSRDAAWLGEASPARRPLVRQGRCGVQGPGSGAGARDSVVWGANSPRRREMQEALCLRAVSVPPLEDVSEGPGGQLGGPASAGEMF